MRVYSSAARALSDNTVRYRRAASSKSATERSASHVASAAEISTSASRPSRPRPRAKSTSFWRCAAHFRLEHDELGQAFEGFRPISQPVEPSRRARASAAPESGRRKGCELPLEHAGFVLVMAAFRVALLEKRPGTLGDRLVALDLRRARRCGNRKGEGSLEQVVDRVAIRVISVQGLDHLEGGRSGVDVQPQAGDAFVERMPLFGQTIGRATAGGQ